MVATARRRTSRLSAYQQMMGYAHLERADYRASQRETKLRPKPRGVPSQGASGDWHFRRDADYLWVGELGREMERNNPIGKRLVNLLDQNVLQEEGFLYNPDTGVASLDDELRHWWRELSADKSRIDLQGKQDFNGLARFVLRDVVAAGDIFAVFNEDGPIELRESHRCRQPFQRGKKHANNVLGIELTDERRMLGAHFTKEEVGPLDSQRIKHDDLAFLGHMDLSTDWPTPNFLHVFAPDRTSQTRGVSMFAPVFDALGMIDDSQFQMMVKDQLSNMILLLRQRGSGFNQKWLNNRLGIGDDDPVPAEVDRLVEQLYPGAEIKGLPDEQISAWSPNIPHESWFDFQRFMLRIIGVTFGVPYVHVMIDTADTTFHGYRGAVLEARELYKKLQRWLACGFHTPCLHNYLHRLADEDPAIGRQRERSLREAKQRRAKPFNLFRHSWTYPRWPSVDDLKDATADLVRLGNSQTSHRRVAQSQDVEWPALSAEIVDDKSLHWMGGMRQAMADLAETIKAASKIGVTIEPSTITLDVLERWAGRYAPLPMAERVQLTMSLADNQQAAPAAGGDDA